MLPSNIPSPPPAWAQFELGPLTIQEPDPLSRTPELRR